MAGMCSAQQLPLRGVGGPAAGGGGGGTLTMVQGPNGANNITNCFGGTGCGLAIQTAEASGNALVFCVLYGVNAGTGVSLSSVSDTRSNTWTVAVGSLARNTTGLTGSSEIGTECAWTTNIAAGANTITPVMSVGTNQLQEYVYEIHDSVGSPSHDQDATGTGSGTTAATASATTPVNGEFGVSFIMANTGGGSAFFTTLGNWISDDNTGAGNNSRITQHQVQATAGALVGNATLTSTDPWVASMVLLKP